MKKLLLLSVIAVLIAAPLVVLSAKAQTKPSGVPPTAKQKQEERVREQHKNEVKHEQQRHYNEVKKEQKEVQHEQQRHYNEVKKEQKNPK